MFTKHLESIPEWWRSDGRRYAATQWKQFLVGSLVGCLMAVLIHLVWRDTIFVPQLKKQWATASMLSAFDGVSAYKLEIVVFCAILSLAFVVWIVPAFVRFLRAWWAGIASFSMLSSATLVITFLSTGSLKSHGTVGVFVVMIIIFGCELWRFQATVGVTTARHVLPVPHIPKHESTFHDQGNWPLTSSDDPIQEWNQDIIGRSSVVELLAEHIFVHRTPIIALNGGLGDGKSSVLNLLRRTISGHAIIVSFSAWLPGSDQTFALDLFRDIATECKRSIYIPQVGKISRAYARTISGSVSFLTGLKEVLPTQSQREEIDEIRNVLGRVPIPIVVLLDEVDRMQHDELLVLLKILRGAASIPNVTFVCAFSKNEIRNRLSSKTELSDDYLDKFFPVSVNLAAPAPEIIGVLFQRRILSEAKAKHWFLGTDEKKFRELLEFTWEESLSRICTNLRRAALLLNDLIAAASPITGEVNTLDLVCIESLRRFEPDIYTLVRKEGSSFLTSGDDSWGEPRVDEKKSRDKEAFLKKLEEEVSRSPESAAARTLLELLFPQVTQGKRNLSRASFRRRANDAQLDQGKRICSPDYFFIYFRAAVPAEMYSEAELSLIIALLNGAKTETERVKIFAEELQRVPANHSKRADFLWKLGLSIQTRLSDVAAEELAYAAAICATDYAYDIMNVGEAAKALNLVFESAQKLSSTPKAQSILTGAMSRAADDTFAIRLLEFTTYQERNKVLTNFTHIDVPRVKDAFIERMRKRYGKTVDTSRLSISQGDWRAFRVWVEQSLIDKEAEQDFWRRFIGTNRKRLAEALNFLYPSGYSWSEDPRKLIGELFPMDEAKHLISSLYEGEPLDDVENKAMSRFEELLGGKWFNIASRDFNTE